MTDTKTGEPRYISDAYELEDFELPVGTIMGIDFGFQRHVSYTTKSALRGVCRDNVSPPSSSSVVKDSLHRNGGLYGCSCFRYMSEV